MIYRRALGPREKGGQARHRRLRASILLRDLTLEPRFRLFHVLGLTRFTNVLTNSISVRPATTPWER